VAVRLQRHLGRVESLEPAQYTVETTTGLPAVCCPGCSTITDLTLKHAIDEGGRVTPAWKCPTETCSFFDYIVLEDFSEEVA
jgi:hypothetical protein